MNSEASSSHPRRRILNLSRVPASILSKNLPEFSIHPWTEDLLNHSASLCREVWGVITDPMVGIPFDLKKFENVQFVFSIGSGVDVFDPALLRPGVRPRLISLKGVFTNSVVVHALALNSKLLAITDGPQKNIGILGMGLIGQKLADEFTTRGLTVRYRNRSPVASSSIEFCGSVDALMEASDTIFVCCPGGAETHGLIAGPQLEKLGPKGRIVNIARGSVIDSTDLFSAIDRGGILGAALDVLEADGALRDKFKRHSKVVMTDHVAWRAVDPTEEILRRLKQAILFSSELD